MVIERCVFCGRVIPKGQRRCRCEEDGKSDNVDAFEGTTNPSTADAVLLPFQGRQGDDKADASRGAANPSTARKGRAKCPRFRDRNDYQGVSRIGCGRDDMQLRFASEDERDEHYAKYCCDRCNECRWFGLNPSGASRHFPFQGRQGILGDAFEGSDE